MMNFGEGTVVEYDFNSGIGWIEPNTDGPKIRFKHKAQAGETVLGQRVLFSLDPRNREKFPVAGSVRFDDEFEPEPAQTSVAKATTPSPPGLKRLQGLIENTAFANGYTRKSPDFKGYVVDKGNPRAGFPPVTVSYNYGLSGEGGKRTNIMNSLPTNANPGLVLDKYIGFEIKNDKEDRDKKVDRDNLFNPNKSYNWMPGKSYWLKEAFVPHYLNTVNTNEYWYAFLHHRCRWEELVKHYRAEVVERKVSWRLAMHLGRESVLENVTIALHPALGFPYLPGQSLKGIAHAYAEYLLRIATGLLDVGEEEKQGVLKDWQNDLFAGCSSGNWLPALRRVKALFGSILHQNKSEENDSTKLKGQFKTAINRELETVQEGQVKKKLIKERDDFAQGQLIFFEAMPFPEKNEVERKWLKLDVLTPHFKDWYDGIQPPSDNQSPNPIYFLTVPNPVKFSLAVGLVGSNVDKEQAKLGLKLLCAGLDDFGAGAKTAAGYGQLVE